MEQFFVTQREFTLRPRARGFHLITDEIIRNLPRLPQAGLFTSVHQAYLCRT